MATRAKPPYGTYAALVGILGAGLSGAAGLTTLLGGRPERLDALDLAVLAAATFKASRTITDDEVTSFLRDPFGGQGARRRREAGRGRRAAPGDR